jgi:hypothetical protein
MSYDAPPPPQSPYGAAPYGGPPAAPNSSKGTWSLVCGIAGLLCCGLLGIPAIILGRQAQAQGQRGTAKAGEILGYIALALTVLYIILYAAGVLKFHASASTN